MSADVLPIRRPDPAPAAPAPAAALPSIIPPLLADARKLAVMLCAGVRTVRTWDSAGKLPQPLRLSGKVLWRIDEIRDWLEAGAPDRETWAAMRDARK